jgi:hypothetical protein
MSVSAVPSRRKGIFDRTMKGAATAEVTVEVERGRIRQFCQAMGEGGAIHSDVAVAQHHGYPDLVAPASYAHVLQYLADEELKRIGHLTVVELIRADFRYVLHGQERYTYHGLIFAGDRLGLKTTIIDFYDKKGGALEFVDLATEIAHLNRGLLVYGMRSLLHVLEERMPT